jgi:hypothetical protein
MLRWCFAVCLGLAALPAIAHAEPPTSHEILSNRPSGFWTSNAPAPKGGEYRYRLLGIGAAVALLTGWLTWRLVKNVKR